MRVFLVVVGCVFFIEACTIEPSIIITKDYISNKYWNKYNHRILIEKMKVKEGDGLDIMNPSFERNTSSHINITSKLEIDSTFIYKNSIVGSSTFEDAKVYFDRKNLNEWSFGHFSIDEKLSVIGALKNNSWYKFSRLRTIPYWVYIYVDNEGKIHRFNVNMSNF